MARTTLASAILLGTLALPLAGVSYAQEQAAPSDARGAATDQMRTMELGSHYQAKDLIGKDVKNDQGDSLGEINNLVIDTSGKITHVVLGTGGIAGLGEKTYAVPWDRIQLSPDRDHIVLNVSKDQLASEFAAFEEKAMEERREEMKDESREDMRKDSGDQSR